MLVEEYKQLLQEGKELPHDARTKLVTMLKEREAQLYEQEREMYQPYRNAPHELEAYAIEEIERRLTTKDKK